MKILNNKSKVSTVALVLMLTITTLMAGTSVANAHDPPWNIPTFILLSVAPDTVGVAQDLIIYTWLTFQPPTASGAWGDRWEDIEVEVTKPDDSKETLGPLTSDPIGFAWTTYTPDQTGTYKFQSSFPGQTLAGENLNPLNPIGQEFIGDYFEPSTSNVVSITVQQDSVTAYPATPPPEDYWTRPISGEHRDWWSFSGNWLESPPVRNDIAFAPYTEGPETAHILWTKPLTMGGLVGGEFGETSYHCGNAYEGQWFPPIIINGILFYNRYPSDIYYGGVGESIEYPRRAALPGFYAVDLRTGEELYYNNDTRIDSGQIYRYDSPNQHGAFAYLWARQGSTWHAYEAFSGDWVYTIENVPGGTQTSDTDGSILIYQLNTQDDWLALWSSSAIPELLGAPTGTENWQWRPYGKTVDGRNGTVWNVTIPADLEGGINYVLEDRIIGSTGLGRTGWTNLETTDYTVWALSLESGQEGALLWEEDYTGPGGLTLNMEAASLEDGVFTIWAPQTREHWGYSLDNGDPLWGPTDPQEAWDFTVGTVGNIAYGKLFTRGYAGIVYCYDAKTGDLEWTWEADDPYYLEAKWGGNYILDIAFVADEKFYVVCGEHSPDDPKERGAVMACIDMEGNELWTLPFYASHWSNNPAIADGIIVFQSTYDNQIYAIGKGPSATTVSAAPKAVAEGSSVVIEGTVMDVSAGTKDYSVAARFPNGVPAIADEDMSEWMKYLYMQYPIPADATGVEVTLDAIDPNGNWTHIGRVTSDVSGTFSHMWTPEAEGKYTIMATFEGSEAYWASYAETAIGVGPAPEAPPEPEEEPAYTAVDLAIIAAVVVAIVIGVVNLWALRKRT